MSSPPLQIRWTYQPNWPFVGRVVVLVIVLVYLSVLAHQGYDLGGTVAALAAAVAAARLVAPAPGEFLTS